MGEVNGRLASEKCSLCGGPSLLLYEKMTDRLFGSPGEWNLLRCKSPDCGLVWLSPKPTVEDISKAYEDYYTHTSVTQNSFAKRQYNLFKQGYLSFHFGYPATSRGVLDGIVGRILALLPHRKAAFNASVMWLEAQPGGRLLEIGCGNGERMTLFNQLGWNVQGIEPDASAAEIAHKEGLNVSVGMLEKTDLASTSFDAIIMSHVIEHLPNPQWVVKECLRLLRPGGKLVMLTPNTDSLGHHWYGRNWLHLDSPRHLYLFNRTSIQKMFDKVDYSHVSCQAVLRDANWTLAASRSLQRTGGYTFGSLPLIEKIYGLLQLYVEWLEMKASPSSGEELLLIAQK